MQSDCALSYKYSTSYHRIPSVPVLRQCRLARSGGRVVKFNISSRWAEQPAESATNYDDVI